MRGVERPAPVVPIVMLSRLIEPPRPVADQPPPPPALVPPPKKATAPATNRATTKPLYEAPSKAPVKAPAVVAQLPSGVNNPAPAPNAPTGTIDPRPPAAPVAAPVAAAQAAPAPASSSAVQLPSSDADYLQNPKPAYPSISRRLNEQGQTTVRVLIGTDGQPQRAEIAKSSGFARLDEAAVAAVLRWRYLPGKRGGVAEAMWFNVPVNWVLN